MSNYKKSTVGFHGKFCAEYDNKFCTWSIQRLVEHAKDHEVKEQSLSSLDQYLKVNAWFHGEKNPTLEAILSHYDRAMKSDLKYPIIICDGLGVVDGLHRLMKAHITNALYIKVIFLRHMPEPDNIEDFDEKARTSQSTQTN